MAVHQRRFNERFREALQALVGERAKGLSANVVVRLKEQWADECEQWCKRDLSDRHYIYVWADGIHAKEGGMRTLKAGSLNG